MVILLMMLVEGLSKVKPSAKEHIRAIDLALVFKGDIIPADAGLDVNHLDVLLRHPAALDLDEGSVSDHMLS